MKRFVSWRLALSALAFMTFLPWLMGASSCNALSEFADKNSDAALLYQARMLIDQSDYDGALLALGLMTSSGQASHDALLVKASAYAARCGLDLFSLATALNNGNTAGNPIFQTLLLTYKGASASQISDCKSAETALAAVPLSSMEAKDHIFFAFLELARIGVVLGGSAIDTSSPKDGTADVSPCTALTSAEAKEIGLSFNYIIRSLNNASSSSAALAAVSTKTGTVCSSINSASGAWGTTNPFCTIYSTAGFNNGGDVTAVRALVNSTDVGTGFCGGTLASSHACRCGLFP